MLRVEIVELLKRILFLNIYSNQQKVKITEVKASILLLLNAKSTPQLRRESIASPDGLKPSRIREEGNINSKSDPYSKQ